MEEKFHHCEKCGCNIYNTDEPDVIDLTNIIHHGCDACNKKFVPKDYDNLWGRKEKSSK